MIKPIKVLVVGCGNMGSSHARAYHKLKGFQLVGLAGRNKKNRQKLSDELGGIDQFDDLETALASVRPDAVSINTYPDSHAEFAIKSMEAGAHIFVEKPLAINEKDAQEVVDTAVRLHRKLVIGYILRVHPSWTKFVEIARTLGKPLVMRMNLNQQSDGTTWPWHKKLMESMPPILDCGVHYVDIMCQMTRSRPVKVHAIGARLTDEVRPDIYNYGQLQVIFKDGSVGWYEAGWGPMMSETAFFVKDVVGPEGSVSIMDTGTVKDSDDIDTHTKTNSLLVHYGKMDKNGNFIRPDEIINTEDEPDHQALCDLEQEFFYRAITEDLDLTDHMNDAVNSLRIVLAADQSIKTGTVVEL